MTPPLDPVVARWMELSELLNGQLVMFESGALTLRSNDINIAPATMIDLQRSILEFDRMISEHDPTGATG
jgi:hypothetical protein